MAKKHKNTMVDISDDQTEAIESIETTITNVVAEEPVKKPDIVFNPITKKNIDVNSLGVNELVSLVKTLAQDLANQYRVNNDLKNDTLILRDSIDSLESIVNTGKDPDDVNTPIEEKPKKVNSCGSTYNSLHTSEYWN